MPGIRPTFSEIGRGFAAYLAPPSPDVIRFTVGQPDFDTPEPCLLYTSPSPRDGLLSRMPSSA